MKTLWKKSRKKLSKDTRPNGFWKPPYPNQGPTLYSEHNPAEKAIKLKKHACSYTIPAQFLLCHTKPDATHGDGLRGQKLCHLLGVVLAHGDPIHGEKGPKFFHQSQKHPAVYLLFGPFWRQFLILKGNWSLDFFWICIRFCHKEHGRKLPGVWFCSDLGWLKFTRGDSWYLMIINDDVSPNIQYIDDWIFTIYRRSVTASTRQQETKYWSIALIHINIISAQKTACLTPYSTCAIKWKTMKQIHYKMQLQTSRLNNQAYRIEIPMELKSFDGIKSRLTFLKLQKKS